MKYSLIEPSLTVISYDRGADRVDFRFEHIGSKILGARLEVWRNGELTFSKLTPDQARDFCVKHKRELVACFNASLALMEGRP